MALPFPSLLPAYKAFTITPGVPFGYPFQFIQGPPTSTLVVDLTGASAALEIVDGSGNSLLTLGSATSPSTGIYFGGIPNTPTNGIVTIVIDTADTTAITWKYARYSMTLTSNVFGLQNLLYGTFVVSGFTP